MTPKSRALDPPFPPFQPSLPSNFFNEKVLNELLVVSRLVSNTMEKNEIQLQTASQLSPIEPHIVEHLQLSPIEPHIVEHRNGEVGSVVVQPHRAALAAAFREGKRGALCELLLKLESLLAGLARE